ncbi:uncharacterized protein LOC116178155 isoform X1 [Photinus pyralis]|nr:uncharacterized protein LOC116178155 isoform X1 [Photinus pyralis]
MYGTGGGPAQVMIRDFLKEIFEKIKAIINLSIEGVAPCRGDSDACLIETSEASSSVAQQKDFADVIFLDLPDACNIEMQHLEPCEERIDISDSAVNEHEIAVTTDWSNYKPSMLRKRKHKLLQQTAKGTPTKYGNTATQVLEEIGNTKAELNKLKMELLRKEDNRKMEIHQQQLQRIKLQNEHLKLQNELLSLQIDKIKNAQ